MGAPVGEGVRAWRRFMAWWTRQTCNHGRGAAWRPARSKGVLARYCNHCKTIDLLSDADFFAQFGEVGYGIKASEFIARTHRG